MEAGVMVIRRDYLLLILPNHVSLPGSRGQNGARAGDARSPATHELCPVRFPRPDHEGVARGVTKMLFF